MTGAPAAQISYGEFGAWYDEYRSSVLEVALGQAQEALETELAGVLTERDQTRLRKLTGRVKSKRRAWRKLRQASYQAKVQTLADIPEAVDDLVGLRITCTNLRDIEMVQAALEALPHRRSGSLWIDATSERDYVAEPKESGYRGWHVNLGTSVEHHGKQVVVSCELQVRTLLQDSWGELTHEDTYSKDGQLPPLVEVLSKRMADLFATLDDIAEDLRTELDRIDEAVVSGEAEAAVVRTAGEAAIVASLEQSEDAASLLLNRWQNLDRPTDLAGLAWELQREFGAEISDDWFGQGSFKRFLLHAVPEGEVSTGRRGYLLPPGTAPASEEAASEELAPDDTALDETVLDEPALAEPAAKSDPGTAAIPKWALELRLIDRGFPLLESQQWLRIYDELAQAWQRQGAGRLSPKAANRLTRAARDRAEDSGTPISRRHLDYVTKAILAVNGSGQPLDSAAIAELFSTLTLQRMADLRILGARNRKGRAVVRRWLTEA